MHRRGAEGADVGHAEAGREEGVGHDRAVAAEFVEARVQLDVRALARGGHDAVAELQQGRDRREVVAGAAAEADGRDDGVDETVEADEGAMGGGLAATGGELLERALAEHGDGMNRPQKKARVRRQTHS